MDRVRPLKIESISGGGSQDNVYPHDTNPNEDGVETRGILIQNDTSDDEAVVISRDASDNMTFTDGVVSSTKTLTDLLSGDYAGHVYEVLTGVTLAIPAGRQFDHLGRFSIEGVLEINGRFVIG